MRGPAALVLALLLASAAPGGEEVFHFRAALPEPGTVAESEQEADLALVLEGGGGDGPVSVRRARASRMTLTVLETGPDRLGKVRVTYGEVSATLAGPGPERREPSPVSGKTYVVAREGERVSVLRPGGGAVTPEESAVAGRVLRERWSGRLGTFLDGKRLARGEVVSLAPAAAEALLALDPGAGAEVGKFDLALLRSEKADGASCAVFFADLRFSAPVPGTGARMSVRLEGELVLRLDGCWLVRTDLAGEVAVGGGEAGAAFRGTGTLALRGRNRYR